MFCIRNIQRTCIAKPLNLISTAKYSRRSDRNTSSYKVVQTKDDALDDFENTVFGVNPNWELLTPRGFRFYLPGSIGPGWLDASTTAQVQVHSKIVPNEIDDFEISKNNRAEESNLPNSEEVFSIVHCTAQECPTLLRKGILELFPSCLEVTSPQLTIVTISQETKSKKSKWSKEMETERLAQYFVLAASDICKKLKICGYWADFINPFSGQPYFNPHKNGVLYKTDERFRSVGFTVKQKKNCKVITHDMSGKDFIGNLYTTAPFSTDFAEVIMNNMKV